MKFIEGQDRATNWGRMHTVELTRRNLTALLNKLNDPDSARTLVDGTNSIMVVAVEDAEHYSDRAPGECLHLEEYPHG